MCENMRAEYLSISYADTVNDLERGDAAVIFCCNKLSRDFYEAFSQKSASQHFLMMLDAEAKMHNKNFHIATHINALVNLI